MTQLQRQLQSSSTSFLDLPGELRNKIYLQVLTVQPPGEYKIKEGSRDICANLLSTCRQINYEARQILYGDNTFTAHNSLLASLPHLRQKSHPVTAAGCISLIRRFHFCLRLDTDAQFSAEDARIAFSGIDSLTIEVQQAMFGGSDRCHLQLFEGVRGVKKVTIYGSIMAFREYARWLEQAMMSPEGSKVEEFVDPQPANVRLRLYDCWMNR